MGVDRLTGWLAGWVIRMLGGGGDTCVRLRLVPCREGGTGVGRWVGWAGLGQVFCWSFAALEGGRRMLAGVDFVPEEKEKRRKKQLAR